MVKTILSFSYDYGTYYVRLLAKSFKENSTTIPMAEMKAMS